MKPTIFAVVSLLAVGCLSTVDERWCGPQQPCTAGFICTPEFHCVRPQGSDGGTGGGRFDGGAGGGGGGGATGGGGGGSSTGGGGGSAVCGAMSCVTGCCLRDNCVPVNQQGHDVCGFFGDACKACNVDQGCVNGVCQLATRFDGGTAAIGGPCVDDSNCGNDGLSFCIPETSAGQPSGFPGGYCSRLCDVEPCPAGRCTEVQTQSGGTAMICLSSCVTQMNCRPSYQCEAGLGGVCLP